MNTTYKSLYPSITLENNIAPNTQIGRIVIDDKVYNNENVYGDPRYQRGGEFIENLVTDNIIEFCKRWLHFAGVSEIIEDMKEFYNTRYFGSGEYKGSYYYNPETQTTIMVPVGYQKVIDPVSFVDKNKIKPVFFITNNAPNITNTNFNSMKEISS